MYAFQMLGKCRVECVNMDAFKLDFTAEQDQIISLNLMPHKPDKVSIFKDGDLALAQKWL